MLPFMRLRQTLKRSIVENMKHRKLSSKSSATGVDEVKKTPVKYSVPPSPKEFSKKKVGKVNCILLTSSILDRLRKLPGRRCSFAPADSNDLHTPKPKNVPISPVRPTKFRKLSSPRNGDCKACASGSSKKCQELPRNSREQSLDYLSSPIRRSLRLSGSSAGSKERRVKKPKTPLFSLPKALFGKNASATKLKRKPSNSGFTTPAMALPKCPPNYTYFRFSSPDFLDKDAAASSTSAVPNARKKRKIWG